MQQYKRASCSQESISYGAQSGCSATARGLGSQCPTAEAVEKCIPSTQLQPPQKAFLPTPPASRDKSQSRTGLRTTQEFPPGWEKPHSYHSRQTVLSSVSSTLYFSLSFFWLSFFCPKQ